MSKTPEWYDESKLVKINFESHERGWAIDMGDGLYRLANHPIRACCADAGDTAAWGDLVRLKPNNGNNSWLEVVEKYVKPAEDTDEVA